MNNTTRTPNVFSPESDTDADRAFTYAALAGAVGGAIWGGICSHLFLGVEVAETAAVLGAMAGCGVFAGVASWAGRVQTAVAARRQAVDHEMVARPAVSLSLRR